MSGATCGLSEVGVTTRFRLILKSDALGVVVPSKIVGCVLVGLRECVCLLSGISWSAARFLLTILPLSFCNKYDLSDIGSSIVPGLHFTARSLTVFTSTGCPYLNVLKSLLPLSYVDAIRCCLSLLAEAISSRSTGFG